MKKLTKAVAAALTLELMCTAPVLCPAAEEIPELKWYTVGGGEPANYESWSETVNAYLEEKLGIHLDVECISWGDWANNRSVIVQTNEPYDIMFVDMGSYVSDVAMGAFLDLTDLLPQVPALTELIPEDYLKACEIGGRLYAIPAYKDSSMTNFFVWTKEYVENHPEYADAHTLGEIGDVLRAVHEETGEGLFLNRDGVSAIVGNKYDSIGSGLPTLGISYRSGENKVVAAFEQEDVMEDLRILHGYYTEGLINSDAAVLDEATGMCALGVAQGWPAAAKGWGEGRGAEVVVSQFEDTVLSNDTVQGSMLAISASSKYPEKALQLIELVNTDTWLRDAMMYGEEGVNFEYVEENGEQRVHKLNTDWTLAGYTQGSFFTMTIEAEADTGISGNYYVDEVLVQNASATASPALGFCFDQEPVADQIAACRAIFEEYKGIIQTGTADPDTEVPAMMEAMRAEGFDDIVAEAQSQLDAWMGEK